MPSDVSTQYADLLRRAEELDPASSKVLNERPTYAYAVRAYQEAIAQGDEQSARAALSRMADALSAARILSGSVEPGIMDL